MCSWGIVLVLVLLCQGFIFENEQEVQAAAFFSFGVLLIVLVTLSTLLVVAKVITRTLKSGQSITFSRNAISMLSVDTKQELFNLCSEDQANKDGGLYFSSSLLQTRLHPAAAQEVLSIVSAVGSDNSSEFAFTTATARDLTQTLQNDISPIRLRPLAFQ
jgi:hypothetical protein